MPNEIYSTASLSFEYGSQKGFVSSNILSTTIEETLAVSHRSLGESYSQNNEITFIIQINNNSKEEIKDINELSYSRGRIRWNWWYVASAVKCVADRWNTHHKELWKVAYYRIDLRDDELVDQILDKWYTLCSGYQWNYKYNTDFAQDSKLDESSFGEKTYWHAVSWRKINWVRCIKDNYKWHTYKWNDINKYAVIPSCSKEVEDWTYFVWAYLFTKVAEDNYEELKRLEKFKTTLNIAIEANSALRHLTNDKKYQNRLHTLNETHRKKMKDIEEQVALHS